jgi:hypothetical protein
VKLRSLLSKKKDFIKNRGRSVDYTDAALARELVVSEVKTRQFNTFPKFVWDWTCKKIVIRKKRGENAHGCCTCPVSWLPTGQRPFNSIQFPSDAIREFDLSKKRLSKI